MNHLDLDLALDLDLDLDPDLDLTLTLTSTLTVALRLDLNLTLQVRGREGPTENLRRLTQLPASIQRSTTQKVAYVCATLTRSLTRCAGATGRDGRAQGW